MTNGDRIRQMSNKELAEVLNDVCNHCIFAEVDLKECSLKCIEGIKAYLESEEKV